METKIDEILKTVNDLKVTNNKIISTINTQNEKISRISKKVDDLFENVSNLTKANQDLNLKVTNLEIKILDMEQSINKENNAPPEQNIIEELMDRQSRSNNIILFNLTEDDNEDDSQKIKNVISSLNQKIEQFTFFRLGKTKSNTPDKPRPVKILLSSQSDVFNILRTQKNLKTTTKWSNVRFSSDRTTKQREEMGILRRTLQQRRDNGEQNIIIKYIKGIPKIVNTTKN
ncbi:uncharacterized protein LOC126553488 [Aphis gossypii]|uniref:uncharacterized protein LOC126553488 n=1 Tax=Aphis gossypii TaxID=80765 RepID=UPI0021593C19|nr:uncharacterized protein LOC126553488 [Aphis gossypii]